MVSKMILDDPTVLIPTEAVLALTELRELLAEALALTAKDGSACYRRKHRLAADCTRYIKRAVAALDPMIEEARRPAEAPRNQHGGDAGHEGRPGQERPSGRRAS
jgi:hypothetical protein